MALVLMALGCLSAANASGATIALANGTVGVPYYQEFSIPPNPASGLCDSLEFNFGTIDPAVRDLSIIPSDQSWCRFYLRGTPSQAGSGRMGVISRNTSNQVIATHDVTLTVLPAVPTTISLSSSLSSAGYGNAITFTASLAGTFANSNSVTFKDGGATLGTVNVDSYSASLTTASLAPGTHTITAVFNGDNTTSTPVSVTVGQARPTTTLRGSASSIAYGSGMRLTAEVFSAYLPGGNVTFKEGSTVLGSVALSGRTADFVLTQPAVGSHSYTATYEGDGNNVAATSPAFSLQVTQATPTLALALSSSSSTYGAPLTATATLSGGAGATGTVTFMDGPRTLGRQVLSNGSASLDLSSLGTGSHLISAVYGGDANNADASSSGVFVQITPVTATVALNTSASSVAYGAPVTFSATVTGNVPSGTVTFKDGSTTLGSATLSGGTASYSTSALSLGSHAISAVYGGDYNNTSASSSNVSVTVNKLTPALVLATSTSAVSIGAPVTFTATLSGGAAATGLVTFMEGATVLGSSAVSNGSATLTVSSLTVGSHAITASYAGDATNQPANASAVSVAVGRVAATAALTTSATAAAYGAPVTLTATVAGNAPGGTVTFMDGATALGNATLAGGSASLSTSSLSVGVHRLSVQYGGDTNNAGAVSAAVMVTIGKSSPAIALVVSANAIPQGAPLNLSATLTGGAAPGGTVSFKDGATTLGTVGVAGGSAVFSISTLGVGVHSITALYNGDANNNALASSAVTVSVASILPAVASLAPSSGPALGNTRVTISGAHLGGASSVLFGGSAARIVANSESELVVIAPAHAAGAVDVVIAAATGSITVSGGYTYAALPDPAQNAAITGMVRAQTQAVHQFATAHLSNFTQRLESLHRDGGQSSFGLSFGQTNSARREPTTWGRNGDIVNYSDSELAYLRQGLRHTGLGSAAAPAARAQDDNLPDLPQSADQTRRRDMAWWISGALDLANQKGTGGQSGSRLSTSGISFGGDYRFSRRVTAGLGAGYSRSNYRADDGGASSVGQGVMGVVYASVRPLDDLYVDLAAGYGALHFNLSRLIGETGATGTGSRGGRQAFGSATVGYEWHGENWLLSPFGRVDIARASLDRYTENGGLGALTYFSQTVRNDAAYLGLRGEFSVPLSFGVFTPQARVAYQRNLQGAGQASMTYADPLLGSPVFSFSDNAQENRQWLLTLGGRLMFKSGMALTVLYTHNAANALVNSQSLNVNLSGQF